MTTIPELGPHCGSWIIVDKRDGSAVFETFNRRTAEAVNQNRYEVRTALDHLASLNKRA